MVLFRHAALTLVIFIELKSRRGRVSPAQKQVRAEMLPTSAVWWMVRTSRAAMMALHLSGVVFRCKWKPPKLRAWEGPFADPTRRLPPSGARKSSAIDCGKNSARERRPRSWRRSATMPRALTLPHRV